jgi:hypothetical protein
MKSMDENMTSPAPKAGVTKDEAPPSVPNEPPPPREIGGPQGPEPTRYGDWERNGRCSDF